MVTALCVVAGAVVLVLIVAYGIEIVRKGMKVPTRCGRCLSEMNLKGSHFECPSCGNITEA